MVPRVYGKNVSVLKIVSISSVLFVRFTVARSTWWYTGRVVPGQFKCRTFKRGSLFFRFDLKVSFPIVPAVLFVWRLFSTPFPRENVSPFWTVYAINLPEQTRLPVSDDPVVSSVIVCKFLVRGRSTCVLILFARGLVRRRNGPSRRSRAGFAPCIIIMVNTRSVYPIE